MVGALADMRDYLVIHGQCDRIHAGFLNNNLTGSLSSAFVVALPEYGQGLLGNFQGQLRLIGGFLFAALVNGGMNEDEDGDAQGIEQNHRQPNFFYQQNCRRKWACHQNDDCHMQGLSQDGGPKAHCPTRARLEKNGVHERPHHTAQNG